MEGGASSSKKFAASKRRAQQRENQAVEAAGAEAFEELSKLVEGFTSDKVGTVELATPMRMDIDHDPVEWLNREGEEQDRDIMMLEDEEEDQDTDKLAIASPPKRKPSLVRAETPIMSNESKKKQRPSSSLTPPPMDTPIAPVNIESPWVVSKPYLTPTGVKSLRKTPTSSNHEYLRYHNALLAYLQTKRRLVERIRLERRTQQQDKEEETAMVTFDDDMTLSTVGSHLVREETRAELDFLKALNGVCWDRADPQKERDEARKEGNFWLLLVTLRELGLASLVWADDEASERQNFNALSVFMEGLAARVHATPLELYQEMQRGSTTSPLMLQRRQNILHWLEKCFAKVLPQGVTRPKHTTCIAGSKLLMQEGLSASDKDAELLRSSLALILAGRLDDAKELMRSSGLPMRAAMWSGGLPSGYLQVANDETQEMDRVAVGNTRRAVWSRTMWAHSEKLKNDPAASADEGAIAAILANHLLDALANASLRTWEKGLYATLTCVVGRLYDEVLHMHNNNRRQMRPPFPGTQFEAKEREQLYATSDVASMTEARIVKVLSSTPFEEMKGDDLVTEATASFIVGKSAISEFLYNSHMDVDTLDEAGLRFLVHLALYVDSLEMCTTPVVLENGTEWRNEILMRYLQHLSARPDLWHMLILYASMLPDSVLVDCLPPLLMPITKQHERQTIVNQMRELLPTVGLDLVILRRLVRIMLQESDRGGETASTDTPTPLDLLKMEAISWLCVSPEHFGDALLCANLLLRQFLLADKVASATLFVQDKCPDAVVQALTASETSESSESSEETNATLASQVEHARSEHVAYQSYLDALQATQEWREALTETPADTPLVDDALGGDPSLLNATEAAIASSQDSRGWIEDKRVASNVVVLAANQAQAALRRVLEHPGGWLLTEDEVNNGGEPDQMERRTQLQRLRVQLLPNVLMLYHEVCIETAAWMSTSLDNGVERLGGTMESVLAALNETETVTNMDDIPLAPQYWTRKAMEVAQLAATDEFGIRSACSVDELQKLLSKLAETAVKYMLYAPQREQFLTK